jgi:hypothetical protein
MIFTDQEESWIKQNKSLPVSHKLADWSNDDWQITSNLLELHVSYHF